MGCVPGSVFGHDLSNIFTRDLNNSPGFAVQHSSLTTADYLN